MAILDGDIQLLKSEVMDDVPEGGGMATGIAVVDGQSNNMFADISELDRTYGRISLRKVFPAVVTDNVDAYYGAHVIVAEPPADPKVSVTLFTTASWSDHRTDAQNKLESYISASAEGRWMLYGNHLAGQRTVQMHCTNAAASPAIDSVLMLVMDANYQYVRVTRLVDREVDVAFEDVRGTFLRDIITVEISDALRYNFAAAVMERYTASWYSPPTRIHTTLAADAASYYGVSPLQLAASLGDLTVRAESIYTQLVPSAMAETPIVGARCAANRSVVVPIAGAASIGFASTLTTTAGAAAVRYFGQAIARGSVSIAVGGVTVVDDGDGALVANAGYSGSVDYETGSVALAKSTAMSSQAATYSAQPACAVSAAGSTASTLITLGNRGYAYVKTLAPAPAPGSTVVSYMAQGKWYSLYDDGAGGLSGDEGTGVGTVNYGTGAVVLTLGALPDADTQILFAWGTPAHYDAHVGSTVFAAPSIKFDIPGGAVAAGSLSIDYLAGGVTKTVTDNGSGGLTGHGTGYIDYANGRVVIRPSLLPDAGSALDVDYAQGGRTAEVFQSTGAVTSVTLANAVLPGSLSVEVIDASGIKHVVRDDGAGALVLVSSTWTAQTAGLLTTSVVSAGVSGSINYGSGALSLSVAVTVQQKYQTGYVWSSSNVVVNAAGSVAVAYRIASDTTGSGQTLSVPVPALQIDLLPSVANTLLAGGVRFTMGGSVFVDRSGSIVRDPSATTNSGTVAGTINYATGTVTLDDYPAGAAPALAVSALTRKGLWTDWQMMFRTAGAPVQSGSLYVAANRADTSAVISGTAGGDGSIAGTLVAGSIDTTTGIVTVRFGQMVTAAGNEAEWWYNAADIVGGQIFKPQMVFPDTAIYNAVTTSSLPLSAAVLGLDPVRLPVDGRVPIFRAGDVAVLHHSASTAPQTVGNGQTVSVGRQRVARLRVVGNDGNTITSGYTQSLDDGEVTFTNVAGYSQPVHIEHRIEDMALVSDVQINGEMVITRPLTHDFPLGSYISSALILGDLHARVSVFFDQQTWTGWFDTQQGSAAVGTYNKTQYPLAVTNRGALQERWEIVFVNTTTVNVIGETVGQILSAVPIAQAIAPLNPATGVPYFSIDPLGWGAGWAAGNVLRFNTIAANYPIQCARTVLQGNSTVQSDQFTLGIRGDIDA